MVEVGSAGAVGVEYSHFDVGEEWEAGFEQRDGKPDFASGRPVLVTAGSVTVVSRVQDHEAVVVLAVSDGAVVPAGEGWDFLGSVEYRPVYGGRMGVWGPTSGPAVSAADPVEVFGRRAVPGEPFLVLDPGVVYEVRCGRGAGGRRRSGSMPHWTVTATCPTADWRRTRCCSFPRGGRRYRSVRRCSRVSGGSRRGTSLR
ncbi:hypothetical protein ACM614_21970 [Streptomyces sp. 12297]